VAKIRMVVRMLIVFMSLSCGLSTSRV
jgi:hypothetical protein